MEISRKYDILVWGVTGFTGSLIAEYLANTISNTKTWDERVNKLTWALGGRNREKLLSLQEKLISKYPNCKDVGIIIADTKDKNSLDDAIKQVKVLIDVVGPYAFYADSVVESCVRNGVHRVDLTGEAHWIRTVIDKYHENAVKNNVLLVHACGMDSLPADILTFIVSDAIKQKGQDVGQVSVYLDDFEVTPSGGTVSTLVEVQKLPESIRKNPYLLCETKGIDKSDEESLRFDKVANKWVGRSVLSLVDCDGKIVRRSSMINNYGPNFSWHELKSYRGPIQAFIATFYVILLSFLVRYSLTRSLMQRTQYKPGEGPSMALMKKSKLRASAIGFSDNKPSEKKIKVTATLAIDGDPGYLETATMIAECAIAIALDYKRLPSSGGVLTPASAFGNIILERLRNAGHMYSTPNLL